jgi:hypothetical protein
MRSLVLLTSSVALLLIGAPCPKNPAIKIVTPAASTPVATFSFQVEIEIATNLDPGSVQVTLNGQPLAVVGGPTVFTATVDPGPPLQDQNTLQVNAQLLSGQGGASVTRDFDYLPPKARASQLSSAGDLITGPLAHNVIGDYMLENDLARFAVQAPGQRDFNQVGAFGGNLIDAEVVEAGVRQGNDNFWEIQPGVNVETVVNAQTVEIVNDGQDGTTAIVRMCGPDDLLDGINPSSVAADAGGTLPAGVDDVDYDVWACTEYRLDPGNRFIEMVTSIENNEAVQIGLLVGDYVSGAGELEQITPDSAAGTVHLAQAGVGEMLTNFGVESLSFFGFDQAEGVSYGVALPQPPAVANVSTTFTTSGVSYVLNGHSIPLVLGFGFPANFLVPAGGSNSFSRWFTVGGGSAASSLESLIDVYGWTDGTLSGCVTEAVTGDPVSGARVAAGYQAGGGTAALNLVRAHFVAGADGCYSGRLPIGGYRVAAGRQGYPYQGGGSTPVTQLVAIADGATTVADVVLPQTGRLRVEAEDESSSGLPTRVGVVGFDPSPPVNLFATVLSANDVKTNLLEDNTADPLPAGFSRTEYTDAGGILEIDLEPGTYWISVSRGGEYSLYTEEVTIAAGATTTVAAQIARVIDTAGFISSDYHVHLINSPDSRISHLNRLRSMAGEGVENIIATDHSVRTDLTADIAADGLDTFLHSTVGEEVTTFDTGHYNAYPQGQDLSRVQTMGSTDWAGPAPPGDDFPSKGHYILSPPEIDALVLTDPVNAGKETVVQINHIDSHFSPLRIDTALEPPASGLIPGHMISGKPSAANPLFFRLDPTIPNYFHLFDALELWNGMTIGHQNEFLDDRIGIWMNLLNQGQIITAISDTDTHTFHDLRTGGARSWTPSSSDAPASIDPAEIGLAVKAGKVSGGQGLYVQARLDAASTGDSADLGLGTPTLVTTTDGSVDLTIDIQAPLWAPYDTIEVYVNASTQVSGTTGGGPAGGVPVPTLYTSVPTHTLTEGVDFSVTTTVVEPSVTGGSRLETRNFVFPLAGLTEDAWVVVLAKGTNGVSEPMFPVYASGLSLAANPTLNDLKTVTAAEAGIRSLGFTNALYIDVDGNGEFDPPGVSVVP